MKIMYVGKEAVVDIPVMDPRNPRGQIARLQGAEIDDALAHELIKGKDWQPANANYTPAPPDTDDPDELAAAGYSAEELAAAKDAAARYQPHASAEAAATSPEVKNPPVDAKP